MPTTIRELTCYDVRFPTSVELDGSDAIHHAPDYSAAYVVLDAPPHEGYGFTFTLGRGNEVVIAAIRALERHVVGARLDDVLADMAGFWRRLASDDQVRWLGPEKGAVHLALAAIVNAVWDLAARRAGKPLWKLLVDMPPEELIRVIDFRYIDDAVSPTQGLDRLRAQAGGKREREELLCALGYPAYTTSPGWLGYDDEKIRRLTRAATRAGFDVVKMKVGQDTESDLRRARIIREELGDGRLLMDANQVWGVDEAIDRMARLTDADPWWIEEPTSPDDILGHARIRRAVAPVRVATGEHCQNRVVFKQLFQADAIDICQIDACRLGGVNENLAVLFLADRFGIPVCPHAGGVGLCEYVQHLSIVDFVCVSGSLENRVIEYVDHLHEHFVSPVRMENGRYLPPMNPGYSAELEPESVEAYTFPAGAAWAA